MLISFRALIEVCPINRADVLLKTLFSFLFLAVKVEFYNSCKIVGSNAKLNSKAKAIKTAVQTIFLMDSNT